MKFHKSSDAAWHQGQWYWSGQSYEIALPKGQRTLVADMPSKPTLKPYTSPRSAEPKE